MVLRQALGKVTVVLPHQLKPRSHGGKLLGRSSYQKEWSEAIPRSNGVLTTVRGGKAHKRWGKVYLWCIGLVATTALPMGPVSPLLFIGRRRSQKSSMQVGSALGRGTLFSFLQRALS